MSLQRLRSWVESAVSEAFGLSPEDAERLAAAAIDGPRSSPAMRAGAIVGLCRATVRLPWVADWWASESGRRAFATLATCPDNSWAALNELCAAPAPDSLDPNWPASRAFWAVERPEGSKPGDEFLVGNGEGNRYVMRVVERDGHVGAQLVKDLGAPLDSYWHQAIAEAEQVAARAAG